MQTQGKILAVDDDADNIAILKELLDDEYDLKVSSSGEDAPEIAREFQPDIVLLDTMVPGMDGYELCRRLRKHHTLKHTKIIMLSARAMVSERLEGYRAGADDYVTKPFDGDEFLAKMRVYLRLKHAEEADQVKHDVTMTAMDKLGIPVAIAKNIISELSTNLFGKIDPKLHHQLEAAKERMDYLERTIGNLLDISEIYAGKATLEPAVFNIQSLVGEVVDLLRSKMASRKIDLNTDMPGEGLLVNADRRKMAKVLANLIHNANRVSCEGSRVSVRVKNLQDRIGVDVEEHGPDGDGADGVFRESDAIEKRGAAGEHGEDLGLAVAGGFVELHGGRLWADDRPDGGAVFSFEIPTSAQIQTGKQPEISDAAAESGVRE